MFINRHMMMERHMLISQHVLISQHKKSQQFVPMQTGRITLSPCVKMTLTLLKIKNKMGKKCSKKIKMISQKNENLLDVQQ